MREEAPSWMAVLNCFTEFQTWRIISQGKNRKGFIIASTSSFDLKLKQDLSCISTMLAKVQDNAQTHSAKWTHAAGIKLRSNPYYSSHSISYYYEK